MPRAGVGFLVGAANPSLPTIGSGERCRLPQRGPGHSIGAFQKLLAYCREHQLLCVALHIFTVQFFSNISKELNPQPHPSPPKYGPVYLHADENITTLQACDMSGMRCGKVKFPGQ